MLSVVDVLLPKSMLEGMASETTKIFYTKTSVGDRHWVTGQAYPEYSDTRFNPPKIMDFAVDASAVYNAPGHEVYEPPLELDEDAVDGIEPISISDALEAESPHDVSEDEQQEERGAYWGVHITNPPEGTGHWFDLPIEPPSAPGSEYYAPLVEALETRLGRTGLMILVH